MTLRADRFLTAHADPGLGRVPAIEGNVPGLTLNAVPALSFRIVAGKETGGRQLTISNTCAGPLARVALGSPRPPRFPTAEGTLFDGSTDGRAGMSQVPRFPRVCEPWGSALDNQMFLSRYQARPVESLSVASGFSLVSTEHRNVVCDRHISGLNPLQVSTNSRRHGDGFVYPRSFVMPDFFAWSAVCQDAPSDLPEASESHFVNSAAPDVFFKLRSLSECAKRHSDPAKRQSV